MGILGKRSKGTPTVLFESFQKSHVSFLPRNIRGKGESRAGERVLGTMKGTTDMTKTSPQTKRRYTEGRHETALPQVCSFL